MRNRQELMTDVGAYVSDDDGELDKRVFLRMVADRINDDLRAAPPVPLLPVFRQCDVCGYFHPIDFSGACPGDETTRAQLEAKHGFEGEGWREIA